MNVTPITPCQDLAVVVLLMLIPLLAPSPDGSSGGFARIAQVRVRDRRHVCVCGRVCVGVGVDV